MLHCYEMFDLQATFYFNNFHKHTEDSDKTVQNYNQWI